MSAQATERGAGAPDSIQRWIMANPVPERSKKFFEQSSSLILPLAKEVARVGGTDIPSFTPADLMLQVGEMMMAVTLARFSPADNYEYRLAVMAAEEGDPERTAELLKRLPPAEIARPIHAQAHIIKAGLLAGDISRIGLSRESEDHLNSAVSLLAQELVARGLVTPAAVSTPESTQ